MKYYVSLPSFLLMASFFLGAGCITIRGGGLDGGVFFSGDSGETWQRKIFVEEIKKKTITIADTNVTRLRVHPRDESILYLATREHGVYRSGNGGDQWQQLALGNRSITDIAIDRVNPNILYAVDGQQIFQSMDEGKIWKLLFIERRERVTIDAFFVHPTRSGELYVGLSSGDLLKSENRGVSWALLKTFPASVTVLTIPALGGNVVYAGTRDGFWKSPNSGKDWFDLSPYLQKYQNARYINQIVVDPRAPQTLFLISRYGLLRSTDEGGSFAPLSLLIPSGNLEILSFAIHPNRPDREWFYGTRTGLYRTTDAGKSWVMRPLPTGRAAMALFFSLKQKGLYLGVTQFKK